MHGGEGGRRGDSDDSEEEERVSWKSLGRRRMVVCCGDTEASWIGGSTTRGGGPTDQWRRFVIHPDNRY